MMQQLTVLIVDDSSEDRQTYHRYLLQDKEYSYTIIEEESGHAALVLCQQFHPNAILLDFNLPDLDGLEFIAELKQQTPKMMPLIIMLTGYGNEDIAVQAMKYGVQDYLVKGRTTADLLRSTIHAAIKNSQLTQELQRTENRFQTSVENLMDCFGIYSAIRNQKGEIIDFQIDYVNAVACKCHGMTKEDQLGQSLCAIFPAYKESGLFNEYCQVLEIGKPLVKESQQFICADKPEQSHRTFDFRITKMEDSCVVSWRDVTEKKHAEEQLRQSQQFIESITEATPGMLYVYDLVAKRNIYINSQVKELLGYTPQQIQNMSIVDMGNLIHPDDIESISAMYPQFNLAQDGEILETELRMQHFNGEWRWFCCRYVVFARNANGSPYQFLGSAIDISESKLTEEALRQSEAKFRRIVESNVVGIYFGDFHGQIFEANDAFLKMFGYTHEELANGSIRWDMMTPSEYQTLDEQKIQELQTLGICTPFEKEYFCKDGTRVPIILGIALIEGREKDGYSACFVLDLTERKQAEEALRQSEELYRYLSDAIPQLVWIANTEGEYVHVNQQWLEYTGERIEEVRGFGWTRYVHPDDLQITMQALLGGMQTGEPYECEKRLRRYDGVYRWHLVRGVPIKNELGQVVKWFGTSTDIEDRKQLEVERVRLLDLEQAARLEAETANQIKDDFVAMVSHDLRSPLNAILGWASILRNRSVDTQTFHRALETIERNAHSQGKLLEDLLNISRILRGKLHLELRQVNLVSIILAAVETAYPTANANDIFLESIIDESIEPIMGDENRLLQVLGNLLSNAIKFTSSGGRVKVSLSQVYDQVEKLKYAQITVSDTGIGISPEYLPFVFERYYQGDSLTYTVDNRAHKQGGLGLGLAIARHLVELHGGTIQATSPGVGKGATFTIKLPV
ncbi:PAS domain S-box protein [Anabaena cylindrica FACHB-243]|uniref:histidine kinase n=1 Tax=Anabaena cylindrica (strain ATCC 27899 / PCC 7122) TaxID=272123 RepID=K9ZMD3_ANACC|nr:MULTISPECIES: PAS domain S-box protein [Anabaena]AFZ59490.1 multi-sensor signal transduction histidine kinase [Anabaena cylindrica PCC 7122]MBD2418846.1 PAS domain S-box protein [Anabaena cylindrica FACHB-243]MBY5281734.1 PAS domain S-box protein [Anabaena sp. CCAP 1446/1C]MBY5311116.1 PAS domain S-box protein [Anabaena sp. CCAP 1446/1C]MCM2406412.1 PAS domain S-box protein [Anabaena sp. CCAP 1446/1C]